MIKAWLYVNADGNVCGFKVNGHGKDFVCAAVSMLCINTVNSLEKLTDAELEYCYDENGGYIECLLPGILKGRENGAAVVLADSLALGLASVSETYGALLEVETKGQNAEVTNIKKCKYFKR